MKGVQISLQDVNIACESCGKVQSFTMEKAKHFDKNNKYICKGCLRVLESVNKAESFRIPEVPTKIIEEKNITNPDIQKIIVPEIVKIGYENGFYQFVRLSDDSLKGKFYDKVDFSIRIIIDSSNKMSNLMTSLGQVQYDPYNEIFVIKSEKKLLDNFFNTGGRYP